MPAFAQYALPFLVVSVSALIIYVLCNTVFAESMTGDDE